MFKALTSLVSWSSKRATSGSSRRRRHFFEALEDRRLLTAVPIGPRVEYPVPNPKDLAGDDIGNTVVLHQPSQNSIWVNPYDTNGQMLSPSVHVATTFTDSESITHRVGVPRIALDDQGSFVTVWHEGNTNGTLGFGSDILARRFTLDGNPIGGRTVISTVGSGDDPFHEAAPDVAINSHGDFAAAWMAQPLVLSNIPGQHLVPTDPRSIQAHIGGSIVEVVGAGAGHPTVGINDDGVVLVAWASDDNGSSGSFESTRARFLSAVGQPLGPVFEMFSFPVTTVIKTSEAGDFIVGSFKGPGESFVRVFDGGGNELLSNSQIPNALNSNDLSMTAQGEFIVAGGNVVTHFDSGGNQQGNASSLPSTIGLINAESLGGNDFLVTRATSTMAFAQRYRLDTPATGTTDVRLDSNDNLVVEDIHGGDTNDNLTVVISGSNLRVTDPDNLLIAGPGSIQVDPHTVDTPLASIAGEVLFDTRGGDDMLTVDFSGGDFVNEIDYRGGTNGAVGDKLALRGGSFASTVYNYDNAHDGSIDVSGNATIQYAELEPITATIDAVDVTLNYSASSETIDVADAGGGQTTVNSTAGETTTFNNPTGTLTINAADGNDTVNVAALANDYSAHLAIVGAGGDDTVNFNQDLLFAADNSVTVVADTINVHGDVTTRGDGGVQLLADRNIAMTPGSSIASVDGEILLEANPAGTASGGLVGISLVGAGVASQNGGISLVGNGGTGKSGVHLAALSLLHSGGTGPDAAPITVDGVGSSNATDVVIDGGSLITSRDGDVAITGSMHGVLLADASHITSTGVGEYAATISIIGEATSPLIPFGGDGVLVLSSASDPVRVGTVDGAINITGHGSGDGVVMSGVVIESTGLGPITIEGEAVGSGSFNMGIDIEGPNVITSVFGDIHLIGESQQRHGIEFSGGTQITSTGSGPSAAAITLEGRNFNTPFWAAILLASRPTNDSQLSTVDGDITIRGESQVGWYGVQIIGEVVSSSGTGPDAGKISIEGITHASATGPIFNSNVTGLPTAGVVIQSDEAAVTSVDGDISVTGSATNGGLYGVWMFSGGVSSTGTGPDAADITISGTVGSDPESSGVGIGGQDRVFLATGEVLRAPRSEGQVATVDGDITVVGSSAGVAGVEVSHDSTVSATGTGRISVTAGSGGVLVDESSVSAVDVALAAPDLAGSNDNVQLVNSATVQATGTAAGRVVIQAGDDVTIESGTAIRAGGAIAIQSDSGDADPGVGAMIDIGGTLQSDVAIALLEGNRDADTFVVGPAVSTDILVLGDDPTTLPGDRLNFQTPSGETATLIPLGSDSGIVRTSGGFADLTYAQIESLNVSGALALQAGSAGSHFHVTATGADSGSVSVTTGGIAGGTFSFDSATSLTFEGSAGDDSLTIDHPAGGLLAPADGIVFNGQDGIDELGLNGGAATPVTYAFANSHDGNVQWEGTSLSYTGLDPIRSTMAASHVVLNYSAASELITASRVRRHSTQVTSTAGETLVFRNPTSSLTIDAGAGDDTVDTSRLRYDVTILGGPGDDSIRAGRGNDTLDGGAGGDVLMGGKGDDLIRGGLGNDLIFAGAGRDIALGGAGDDLIDGGRGRDLLIGGAGRDVLLGRAGGDAPIGGNTNVDDDDDALQAVLAAWTSRSSYADRVAAVDALLAASDDEERDFLIGRGGRDLFYDGIDDLLVDVKPRESVL